MLGRLPTRTDVDLSGFTEAQQKGIELVQSADAVLQFYDRDTTPEMAEAGMTPMQIIVSATKNAAEYLELEGLGTLAPGYRADFIILDADPLSDIRNTRKISQVFINGKEVDY